MSEKRTIRSLLQNPTGKQISKHWDIVDDTTGIQFYSFAPDQVGTTKWNSSMAAKHTTLTHHMPHTAHFQDSSYIQTPILVIFTVPASTTGTFTVQQDPLPTGIDSYPLPTEYWTRPIEAENTYWYTIASNWLSSPYITDRTQDSGIAPNSAHIMWTKPIDTGGVVGGMYGDIQGESFYPGRSYNPRFNNPDSDERSSLLRVATR